MARVGGHKHRKKTVKTCGSWLASDGVQSVNIIMACPTAIAGKPAPTGFVALPTIAANTNQLWELACQRWRPVSQHHHRLTHRHREQAHSYRVHGVLNYHSQHKSTVGASLLAMASSQPTSSWPDPPPSLASQLPQGLWRSQLSQASSHRVCGASNYHSQHKSTVGAGLLAMASGQPTSSSPDPPPSRAGSLLQGAVALTKAINSQQMLGNQFRHFNHRRPAGEFKLHFAQRREIDFQLGVQVEGA